MKACIRFLSLTTFALTIFLFNSCSNEPDPPGLTTQDVTDIDYRSASCGGNVTENGGEPIISRGICWNTTGNPTIDDSTANCGSGTGPFHKGLENLHPGTTYYVRAYATNSSKTGYGNEVTFKTRTVMIPDITTYHIFFYSQTSIRSGGMVTHDYGGIISERGVCWSTSPQPDINSEKKVYETPEAVNFYVDISGLIPGTTYYLRAYATNEAGTGYGNEIKFTIHVDGTAVSDIDGNVYNTTKIGTQTWLAENLKTTRFNDGTPLVNITNIYGGGTLSAYAWYINNEALYKNEYGALYNYYSIASWASFERNVCPAGWHVPYDSEWSALTSFLGGERFAGGKLKESGTTHWAAPNTEATDQYGFRALPGGSTNFSYGFSSMGITGSWWSSDNSYYNNEYYNMIYVMDAYSGSMVRLPANGNNGYSVRCIRDY
jgi:uncharacterized protein (TIGR02145 family)